MVADKLDIAYNIMKILSMPIERKKALERVADLAYNINIHLAKRLLIVDEQNYSYWEDEIDNWLTQIDSISIDSKTRKLKEKDIYFQLSESSLKRTKVLKQKVIRVYRGSSRNSKIKIREITDEQVISLILKVLSDFSKESSDYSFIDLRELKSYKQALKEIEKYNIKYV